MPDSRGSSSGALRTKRILSRISVTMLKMLPTYGDLDRIDTAIRRSVKLVADRDRLLAVTERMRRLRDQLGDLAPPGTPCWKFDQDREFAAAWKEESDDAT